MTGSVNQCQKNHKTHSSVFNICESVTCTILLQREGVIMNGKVVSQAAPEFIWSEMSAHSTMT